MTEVTIRLQTEQPRIDPAFFDNLNHLAEQYGLRIEEALDPSDSTRIVREGRDWLDRRDAKRAAQSKGPRTDFSHLDRIRG